MEVGRDRRGSREGGKEGGREGGKEGGREGGREGRREYIFIYIRNSAMLPLYFMTWTQYSPAD